MAHRGLGVDDLAKPHKSRPSINDLPLSLTTVGTSQSHHTDRRASEGSLPPTLLRPLERAKLEDDLAGDTSQRDIAAEAASMKKARDTVWPAEAIRHSLPKSMHVLANEAISDWLALPSTNFRDVQHPLPFKGPGQLDEVTRFKPTVEEKLEAALRVMRGFEDDQSCLNGHMFMMKQEQSALEYLQRVSREETDSKVTALEKDVRGMRERLSTTQEELSKTKEELSATKTELVATQENLAAVEKRQWEVEVMELHRRLARLESIASK